MRAGAHPAVMLHDGACIDNTVGAHGGVRVEHRSGQDHGPLAQDHAPAHPGSRMDGGMPFHLHLPGQLPAQSVVSQAEHEHHPVRPGLPCTKGPQHRNIPNSIAGRVVIQEPQHCVAGGKDSVSHHLSMASGTQDDHLFRHRISSPVPWNSSIVALVPLEMPSRRITLETVCKRIFKSPQAVIRET